MKVPQARKLPSGTWFIQLRLGGESIPVTGRTEKECKDRATLIKAEHRATSGTRAATGGDMTLREACQKHIDRKERAGRSPSTIRGYDIIARTCFKDYMDKRVDSIRSWQAVYDAEAARVSPKTMANAWAFLRAAVKTECKITLPDVETVALERHEHAFLEPEQVKAFVAAIKGHKYEIPMLLALSSWRSSEIMALDWCNVDLEHSRIKVQGAVVRDKHNKAAEKAKNKTLESTRYVPIFMPELRAALEAVEDKTGKVVTAAPNTIYRAINRVCRDNGFPEVGTHGLRHSFASLAYSLGVPIKVTMQIGGWSDYNTMLKIYTHLSKRDVGKYASDISKFFGNANENANASKKG